MIQRPTEHSGGIDWLDKQIQAIPPAIVKSSDDLRQRVRRFLAASNVPGLRHVQIEVEGDTIYLRGQVRTFYEKQLAARLSRRVAGVIHVVDQIEARGYPPQVDNGRDSRRRGCENPPSAED